MKSHFDFLEIDACLDRLYQSKLDGLTKPVGSLGRLEDLARRWASIRHPELASIERQRLFIFAADHGVAEEGVSAYPQIVTYQMVENFLRRGAAISVLCQDFTIEDVVIDVGVARNFAGPSKPIDRKVRPGTASFLSGPAMTREECREAVAVGFDQAVQAAEEGMGLLGTGEMGIGNSTAAAAVLCALLGAKAGDLAGRGTGVEGGAYRRKVAVIEEGLQRHGCTPESDPLHVLSSVGGLEIAALCGLILGAAERGVPIVVDGFIATAAAVAALGLSSNLEGYLFWSHCSREKGHRAVLDQLGVEPILDLNLCLGEGTGAALAMHLIRSSVHLLTRMATFEEADVSRA